MNSTVIIHNMKVSSIRNWEAIEKVNYGQQYTW